MDLREEPQGRPKYRCGVSDRRGLLCMIWKLRIEMVSGME